MIGAVRVEAASGKEVSRRHELGLALGLDVQHPLFVFVLADLVERILVGVLLVGLYGRDLLRRDVLQGFHRGLSEEQGTVHIDVGHRFSQYRYAGFRNLYARHLLEYVDGHFALQRLHCRGVENYGVALDGDGGDSFPDYGTVYRVFHRFQVREELVLSGGDGHEVGFLFISYHAESHVGLSHGHYPEEETAFVGDRRIERVGGLEGLVLLLLERYHHYRNAGSGDFLPAFFIGGEDYAADNPSDVVHLVSSHTHSSRLCKEGRAEENQDGDDAEAQESWCHGVWNLL